MFAESAAIGGVHLQQVDRCSANRCKPNNEYPVALEVLIPLVLTGMKQSDKCAAFGVKRANVWPLVRIAMIAGKSQVRLFVTSAMLAGHDVFYVVVKKGSTACGK